MPTFTKEWWGSDSGNEGDWGHAANWVPVSIRSATFKWTASGGGGTNEYYLELAAGGDPGLASPGSVQEDGAELASAAPGALAAGGYGYGDVDSLGFSTIYVRLSDGADPDTKSSGYVTATLKPAAGDSVQVPAGSADISAGLDQSAVALAAVLFLAGYTGAVGDTSGALPKYLKLNCTRFEFSGTGTAYIDLGASNIPAAVLQAGTGNTGTHGLYLLGSDLTDVTVEKGNVGIAVRGGETSTVAQLRVGDGGDCTCGPGVTLTNHEQAGGNGTLRCAVSGTIEQYAGECRTEGVGTVATWKVDGGTAVPNSTGDITTMDLNAGEADFLQSNQPRTVDTLNVGSQDARRLLLDPDVVTVTNFNLPTGRFDARWALPA